MRIERNGRAENVDITGVGGKVRFSVGEVGNRSGVWNIWANKSTSDVYLAARENATVQKFSLHQSGDWRFAWISEDVAEAYGQDNRVIDRWTRPAADEVGWIKAVQIRVRPQDVVAMPDDKTPAAKVHWLPAPPAEHILVVRLVYVIPDRGAPHIDNYQLIDVLALANGDALLIIATIDKVTDEVTANLREAIESLRERRSDLLANAAENPSVRAAIFGHSSEGERIVWDIAVPALDSH